MASLASVCTFRRRLSCYRWFIRCGDIMVAASALGAAPDPPQILPIETVAPTVYVWGYLALAR